VTETEEGEAMGHLKAYVIVFNVPMGNLSPTHFAEQIEHIRGTFKQEIFEDHLNAPCMVLFCPVTSGDTGINIYEIHPDSNKQMELYNIVINESYARHTMSTAAGEILAMIKHGMKK